MKISALNTIDRPREKLSKKGAIALSEFELLQALIGSGTSQSDVSSIAKNIQKLLKKYGHDIPHIELEKITGLGSAKVSVLLAAFELSRRLLVQHDAPVIDSPQRVIEQVADIRDKKQEYFVCLSLDGANRLIAKRTITIGTLTSSLVHPREVFADAITDRAASIIVVHNHPSGTVEPSEADRSVTKRLQDAGTMLGITLLDHIIVTKNSYKNIM